MGKIISDAACPACQEMGHDSTSNHLLLFEDGGAYCGKKEYHKDGKVYVVRPEGGVESKEEERYEEVQLNLSEVEDIKKLPHLANPQRKTNEEDASFFRIRYECSEVDGEIERIYYPYTKDNKPAGYKVREKFQEWDKQVKKNPALLGVFKKFRTVGQVRDADFFGRYFCKCGRIIIT
jgi:Zn ribbon nucleic-acid-binding protein